MELKEVMIETDCLNAVNYALNINLEISWQAKQYLYEVTPVLNKCACISIRWITRECNHIVDDFAKWVLHDQIKGSFNFCDLPPPICCKIMEQTSLL